MINPIGRFQDFEVSLQKYLPPLPPPYIFLKNSKSKIENKNF